MTLAEGQPSSHQTIPENFVNFQAATALKLQLDPNVARTGASQLESQFTQLASSEPDIIAEHLNNILAGTDAELPPESRAAAFGLIAKEQYVVNEQAALEAIQSGLGVLSQHNQAAGDAATYQTTNVIGANQSLRDAYQYRVGGNIQTGAPGEAVQQAHSHMQDETTFAASATNNFVANLTELSAKQQHVVGRFSSDVAWHLSRQQQLAEGVEAVTESTPANDPIDLRKFVDDAVISFVAGKLAESLKQTDVRLVENIAEALEQAPDAQRCMAAHDLVNAAGEYSGELGRKTSTIATSAANYRVQLQQFYALGYQVFRPGMPPQSLHQAFDEQLERLRASSEKASNLSADGRDIITWSDEQVHNLQTALASAQTY